MKKYILPITTALAFTCMPLCTADDTPAEAPAQAEQEALAPVPEALSKLKFFHNRPSLKAQYYIYLQSASWCGPCRMEMPHIVEQYKTMKEDGRVEVILVGFDRFEQDAQDYLMQYHATFGGIMANDPGVSTLPGFTRARGIPMAIIVDANGKVLFSGHAARIARGGWKDYTINAKEGE